LNDASAQTAPPRDIAFTIRPIEAEDSDALRALFWRLSPESRYYRFLSPVNRPEERVLHHLAEVDHGVRDALVAVVDELVVGVARYDRDPSDPSAAEVAIVVEDAWHRHGIATALIHELSKLADARGIEHFTATVAADNRAVSTFVSSLPVHAKWNWDHGQRQLGVELVAHSSAGGSSTPIES
jgi:RimJ/RimL family protein N-acetyltransferase